MKKILIIALIFLGVSLNGSAQDNKPCCKSESKEACNSEEVSTDKSCSEGVKEITISVPGKCNMCKSNIEDAALSVDGVSKASWDAKKKELSYTLDTSKNSKDAVNKAISEVGYDAGEFKANEKAYNALPKCCKYKTL